MKKLLSTLIVATFSLTMLTGAIFVPDKAELGVAKNYIKNGGIERNKAGFATYKDAAGALPVDGSGGSPSHISIAASSSSPLKDSASLVITNSGSSSAQGEGLSYDFTIDSGDQGQVLNVSMDYSLVSGTFIAGSIVGSTIIDSDLEMFIYDVTNAAVIQPSGYILTCGAVVGTICSNPSVQFQAAVNSTSYRLIWHVPTTHTSAWAMKIDNIVASRVLKTYGSVITSLTTYTSTLSPQGSTCVPGSIAAGTNTQNGYWYQSGPNMVFHFGFIQTATGTNGSNCIYGWTFPKAIDTSHLVTIPSPTIGGTFHGKGYGTCSLGTNNSIYNNGEVILIDSTHFIITIATGNAANSFAWSDAGSTGFFSGSSNIQVSCDVILPILGASSSVQTSDSADTRVVGASYTLATTQSVNATPSKVQFNTKQFDTHGAFDTVNFRYIAPVSGVYHVHGGILVAGTSTAGANSACMVYKNGTQVSYSIQSHDAASATTNKACTYSTNVSLNAGEYVEVFAANGITTLNLQGDSVQPGGVIFNIEKISGPTSFPAADQVYVAYALSANFTAGPTIPVNFDVKVVDNCGCVTVSPTAWKFTAPSAGTYSVGGMQHVSVAQGINIYKNGSSFYAVGDGTFESPYYGIVRLNAGDFIDVRNITSNGTWDGNGAAGSNTSTINIVRIGN